MEAPSLETYKLKQEGLWATYLDVGPSFQKLWKPEVYFCSGVHLLIFTSVKKKLKIKNLKKKLMLCNDIFQHSINLLFMNLQLDYKNLSEFKDKHTLSKQRTEISPLV